MQLNETPTVDHSASRQCEDRHFIASEVTQVTLGYRDTDGEERVLQGRLSDLSEEGVKIAVNGRVPIGTTAQLIIFPSTIDIEVKRSVTIQWQQPRDANNWWTGCSVVEAFDKEIIETLAAANILDRRGDPRYSVSKQVIVRWELEEQHHEVRMINYSKGGFCIQADEQDCSHSHRLLLIFETPDGKQHTIPARVIWQGQTESGYCVGCSFSTMDGFLLVRNFVAPNGVSRRLAGQGRTRKSEMLHWLAIAVMVFALVQAVHLFFG